LLFCSSRFSSTRSEAFCFRPKHLDKPLDLPIDNQHEQQTAVAELLLATLTQDPLQEEANIDDDEQQTYA
jgi:hypothetical protein